jgi:4-amino-4-deoxy-L-arabinose transferase-like glycosyltransferase
MAMVVGAMAALMFGARVSGHWWGDDWALYVKQAQSLLDGNPGHAAAQNQFTIDGSVGPVFSPPIYPWGYPLLLAPFVAVVGADVDQLSIVSVLSASAFACAWYGLARPRLERIPTLIGTVAVSITPLLFDWTELIQPELPFLAITATALVGLDRLAASGSLVSIESRVAPLALLGLGAAASFMVRREGLAVVGAIAAAQLATGAVKATKPIIVRVLVPYATALVSVGIVMATLPTTLVPRYTGNSLTNVWRFSGDHIENLAEVSGLKKPWDESAVVLGSEVLGGVAVVGYVAAAVAGLMLAITLNRRRDVHLVVYAVGALLIGGSFRAPGNRFVASVAPIALLLGLVALAAGLRRYRGANFASWSVATLLLALVAGNLAHVYQRIDRVSEAAAIGFVEFGPTHPDSIEMFEAVKIFSDPADVVAAPKARALTLMTDRWAVQIDDQRPLAQGLEPALIVTETSAALTGLLLAQPDRFVEVWRNASFVLFQPRVAASAATNGDGSSSTASP